MASPPAKVTACPSAIPTSKNLDLCLFLNSTSPVPEVIAAVIAQIRGSTSAISQIALPNSFEKFLLFLFKEMPFSTSKGGTQ